jgi:ribose transport system ATP-binding protein
MATQVDTPGPSGRPSDVGVAPLIAIENLSKTFPGTRALDEVTLVLRAGEVHALLGQNGCGKSTLIKVLTGFHEPDPGSHVLVDGRPGSFTRIGPAPDGGEPVHVRAVHQHLGLVSRLSILDNVALVTGYTRGFAGRVDWNAQQELTRELLARVGLDDIDVYTPVELITPLQRTQVAIARALHGWGKDAAGLLILDEPTASLPAEQAEELFELVRRLRDGGVAVVYVSHRLDDLVQIADHVTVLRDGRAVSSSSMVGLTHEDLVNLMLGKQAAERAHSTVRDRTVEAQRHATDERPPAKLRVTGLTGSQLRDLDFEVASGEILGITGLVGAGQDELPYLLVGAKRAVRGTMLLAEGTYDIPTLTLRQATGLGIALVPADRAAEAILPQCDIAQNISLPRLNAFRRTGWLRRSLERAEAEAWIQRLSVSPARHDKLVTELSGGNAQKVVLARWLAVAKGALLLAEPTAGVDIGAKSLIYTHLRAAAAEGLPIVVCSTDAMDLEQLCDRILVLADGTVKAELTGADINEDTIDHAILSASEGHS